MLGATCTSGYYHNAVPLTMSGKHWKVIVQEKQAERTARIAEAVTLTKQETSPGALLDEQYLHSTGKFILQFTRT